MENGLAIYQDISDLVFTKWPQYSEFKMRKDKTHEKLEVIHQEKNQGLKGYLLEILQEESRYIEAMCKCAKYSARFCQDLNDLSLEELLQLMKSDVKFKADLEDIQLLGESEFQYKMSYDLQLNELKKTFKLYQRKQKDLATKIKKTIIHTTVLTLILSTEFSWLLLGPKKYLPMIHVVLLAIYTFQFLTLYLNRSELKIERGRSGSKIQLPFCLFNHLLFLVYLSVYRKNPSKPIQSPDLDAESIRQWCAQGSKDKLRNYLTENWHDIDINKPKDYSTPLLLAIKNRHFTVVKILFTIYGEKLETGFRDEKGDNALDLAVQQRNTELFNLLLKYSAVTHISSLILAVKNDEVKMIKDLISKVPRGKIIDIIKPLTEFCDSIDKLKDKNLPKNRRKELEKCTFEIRKNLLEKMEQKACSSADFVCPGCQMVMKSPLKIYSCTNDHHLFCSQCLEQGLILKCLNTLCHEDFTVHIPHRRLTSERLVTCLLETKADQ